MRSRRTAATIGLLLSGAWFVAYGTDAGAQNPPMCNGKAATIVGTQGDDILRGTSGRDVIVGLGGDDHISGLGGADTICSGPGRDLVWGNAGKDTIFSAGSADRIFGGPGDDILDGGGGSDRVFGGRGVDIVEGNTGFDRLYGGPDADQCLTDTADVFLRDCEDGNYKRFAAIGDRLIRPRLDSSFVVAEHCFDFINLCDKFYVARVKLDGTTSFDSLGVEAYNIAGNRIAAYGDAADRFTGVFLFNERPVRLEIDSGGGAWEVLFVELSGVRVGAASTAGTGNQVYTVKRPLRTGLVTADVGWNGFGHFAVVGVSPDDGRDLLVNEVRFQGQDTPPFSSTTVASRGITIVQVLSEGTWSVELSN